MARKVSALIAAGAIAGLLSGCAQEPPKCSNPSTFDLVKSILLEQMGLKDELSEQEIRDVLVIEMPRASALDERIKRYSCEARIVAGGAYQVPITYASQLDDQDQHLVTFDGIQPADLFAVKYAIVTAVTQARAASQSAEAVPTTVTKAASTTSVSASDIAGSWQGLLEGEGGMSITPAAAGYEVALHVASPSGCTGEIDGAATLEGNVLTLFKQEDDQRCTISVTFDGATAHVDEDGCSYYHGVSCGFTGTLQRVQ